MRYIYILFFLLSLTHQKAQQFYFKNYSAENGLPFVQVYCMFQDSKGFLWSGGYGGLSKFDGRSFVNYSPKNGLIDHYVNAITEDEAGRIYVGTQEGLSIIDGRKITNYGYNQGLNARNVKALYKGQQHGVYMGTDNGLYKLSRDSIKELSQFKGLNINCLTKMSNNALAVGTNNGLILFGHEGFIRVDTSNGLPNANVNCVLELKSKSALLIGTSKGLALYDLAAKKCTNYFIQNGLIDEQITALLHEHDEKIWIGSTSGLMLFDSKTFTFYNVGLEPNANLIRGLLMDYEDNLWIGTHNGLFKYRDNSFNAYDKLTGPGNASIYSIFRDRKNNLWMCSDNNGIYKYSQGFFKRYGLRDGLPSIICRAGLEDNDGRLWFSTDRGVSVFENETFYNLSLPSDFEGSYDALYKAKDGTIYIGGAGAYAKSVKLMNGYHLSKRDMPYKTKKQVEAFCEDKQGNLWIGTWGAGLWVEDKTGKMKNYCTEHKINVDGFFNLHVDADNVLYAATLSGLFVLDIDKNKFKFITEKDGLNSELCYSIGFAENQKALWIGTNQGINKLDIEALKRNDRVYIKSLGRNEGFTGVECNANGIWEDKDGTLWFGTVSGLVRHQPKVFKRNLFAPRVVFNSIELMNKDTLLTENSKLSHDENSIAFYYRGICLTNPDNVLYQHKLEGLEKDWSAPTSDYYSKYSNLPPGKYVFKVKSSNNEGVWNEIPAEFAFLIKTPFYKTWWFIGLLVLAIVFGLYVFFLIRIKNIKRIQKIEYERKVEMSKIELKALRSQMNPHFVFNSLNSIQHYIYNSKSEEAIKYLNKFARLVRIILNNSDKPTVTVAEDLEALRLYLELEQMRFENKFEYKIEVNESVDEDYDVMPPLLMQPYVENAILHGLNPKPEKGFLTINISTQNNLIVCTITDNGIGRKQASEIKRTMPGNKHKSLGMKITEDRLKILNELHRSNLNIKIIDLEDDNGNSKGTQVVIYIPIIS
jgi:ligand-binding sensor domain-containing protein